MMNWIEFIGIGATIFVLISFVSSDLKHVRYINMVGCVLWILYGVLSNATSVWILNGCCLMLHIYKLWIQKSGKKDNLNESDKD